ncbi:MAG: TrbI/VirB10 family protein [Verrucomicrobia bacterium]|nr:TrbI/VirB10 family protein [Verrucomicrobiota bacterium]
MKARLLDFLHTRVGQVIAILSLVGLVIGLASLPSKRTTTPQRQPSNLPAAGSNAHLTITRPSLPVVPVPMKREGFGGTNQHPILFSVHVELPTQTNVTVADQVPFGRLLQCQLVNTLESLTPNTPIIGLTTEDVWWNGQNVLPSGTEVHGIGNLERVRERITASGSWHLVLPHGVQLTVTGTALDREFDVAEQGWGITDGSAGIRGEVLRNDSLAEVKLFLATALSGLAEGLQETHPTPFGFGVSRSARNLAQGGASAVLNTYSAQILEAIKRDGIFVRVPAGKQFYLYITQSIDVTTIRPGNLPLPDGP